MASDSVPRCIDRIRVIDSHTGGEPTRVVVEGGPALGSGSIADRLALLRREHDWLRRTLVREPRGSEVMVGALLEKPTSTDAAAAVIFFNNVGYLGMCGHGAIGVIATLAFLGRIQPSIHRLQTPVGDVLARLHEDGRVSIQNVRCYRYRKAVSVDVSSVGTVVGDIAWGGNWFFLVSRHDCQLDLSRAAQLTELAWKIRLALRDQRITGAGGSEIDHIELFGAPTDTDVAHSRNFVLCPGKAYDRSACGTGTSAKLACLAADGLLEPGQMWRQQSIVGTILEASYHRDGDAIVPTITGSAYVTADVTLIMDPRDPFAHGIGG